MFNTFPFHSKTLKDKLSTIERALACTSKLYDLAMQHSNTFHLLNNAELNVLLYRPYIGQAYGLIVETIIGGFDLLMYSSE
jgi:hypothetical protein